MCVVTLGENKNQTKVEMRLAPLFLHRKEDDFNNLERVRQEYKVVKEQGPMKIY